MTRPSSRPTTAVTNSAVERASTRAISHVAGTIVRYGRMAKPTTIHATTHAARSAPAYPVSWNRPWPAPASTRPISPPSAAPSTRI